MSLATPPPLDQPIALPSAAPPPYTPSPHPPGPVKSAEMVKAWQKGNASQKAKGKSTVRPRFSFDTIAHARLRAQFWDEVHLDFMWAQASDNEIVRGFLDENLWTEAANKMTALMLERFPDEFTPPPPLLPGEVGAEQQVSDGTTLSSAVEQDKVRERRIKRSEVVRTVCIV